MLKHLEIKKEITKLFSKNYSRYNTIKANKPQYKLSMNLNTANSFISSIKKKESYLKSDSLSEIKSDENFNSSKKIATPMEKNKEFASK